MTNLKDEGKEPYIPSMHFKNIVPYDFLFTADGEDFLKKLEQYQSQANESYEDLNVQIGFMQQEINAQKCVKCGKALLQDGSGWLHGNAKIFMTQPEIVDNKRWNEKSIKVEDFEINLHLCYECVGKLKLYKEMPNREFNI